MQTLPATLVAVALLLTVSTVLGAAVLAVCGRRQVPWFAPAIGFSVLLIVAGAAIRLPGDDLAAIGAIGVSLVVAVAVLVARRPSRPSGAGILAGALALALVSLPFVVAQRIGLLGVSFNNDPRVHLLWIEGVREDAWEAIYGLPLGYPLAPHALVAALAGVTGASAEVAFNAVVIAVPILAALAACAALEEFGRGRAALASVLVGLPYLVASYTGEAAFKEPIQALFVVAFAVVLREATQGRLERRGAIVSLALLAAGTVYNYSYPGAAWLAGTLGLWVLAEAAVRARKRDWGSIRRSTRDLVVAGALLGVLALVLVLPEVPRILDLFENVGGSAAGGGEIAADDVGNLVGRLNPATALNVWPYEDFRLPREGDRALAATVIGAGASALAFLWSVARREFVLPAALLACVAVWWRLDHTESPYIAAKGLVVLAPVAMLMVWIAIFDLWRRTRRVTRAAVTAGAVVIGALALGSSAQALRFAHVGTLDGPSQELADLRATVGERPTLFLGHDDFYRYRLGPTPMSHPILETTIPWIPSTEKLSQYGQAFDFDSAQPQSLDRFDFVITTAAAYQSSPPPNFVVQRRTPAYVLWRRTGSTPPYHTLSEPNAAGERLDCTSPVGLDLSRRRGTAWVLPDPVVGPPIPALYAGSQTSFTMDLPAGEWDLSLQYTSHQDVRLRAPGFSQTLPASMDRPGPFWPAGHIRWRGGPLTMDVEVDAEGVLAPDHYMVAGALVATRAGAEPQRMPLREACGRYVDRYTLAG